MCSWVHTGIITRELVSQYYHLFVHFGVALRHVRLTRNFDQTTNLSFWTSKKKKKNWIFSLRPTGEKRVWKISISPTLSDVIGMTNIRILFAPVRLVDWWEGGKPLYHRYFLSIIIRIINEFLEINYIYRQPERESPNVNIYV